MPLPRLHLLAPLWLALFLALSGASLAASQEEEPELDAWQQKIARDHRISFTRRTEHDARADLLRKEMTPTERARALMALGCARPEAIRERPVLEKWAREGSMIERRAAILALGELGIGVEAILYELLDAPELEVRSAAMLGLLGTDRSSAREELDGIAAGEGPDAELAASLLVYTVDPTISRRTEIAEASLDLRWEAAQQYGLVDGQSWALRVLEDLLAQEEFLDAVILRGAAEFDEFGVKDHILSVLLQTGSVSAIQAATRAMPAELAALIENELWVPRSAGAWQVILRQIDEAQMEDEALELLALSLDEPLVQAHALLLLARAGITEPLIGIEHDWEKLTDEERVHVAKAVGVVGSEEAVAWLSRFEDHRSDLVAATTRITRARLGDQEAYDEQRAILLDPEHPEFRASVEVAVRMLDVRFIREQLKEILLELEESDQILVATELAMRGDLGARALLAEAVRDELPSGRQGVRVVRALMGRDAAGEIELFKKHFPVEGDLLVNVELALALIDAKDDLALLFLRRALWSDPFDRSILAALLLIRVTGMYGLRDELYRAPVTASSRDFRRLGFALGEWGGLDTVEYLQNRAGLLPGRPILQGAVLGALSRRTH